MRRLVLALSAASLLACGDSTGPSSAVGTWNLVSVNGSGLPFTIFQVGTTYKLELMSEQFVAHENGSYTATATTRENDNGRITTTTENAFGTWSQSGNAVTLIDGSDGTASTGTISGNTITADDAENGFTAVFRRQ
jgi:lipocalin-like protein